MGERLYHATMASMAGGQWGPERVGTDVCQWLPSNRPFALTAR
jgi:hypothetical protein